jgi:predicted O-methyltransferase YrrM
VNFLFRGFNYLKHIIKSGNEHAVQSPFLFYFYITAIYTNKQFYSFESIEKLRNKALHNTNSIEVLDLGAGSTKLQNNKRLISDIAKTSSKNSAIGQLLFRLVWHSKSTNILELGTSLGFSTSYLASTNTKSHVVTIEGCPQISKFAQQTFNKLNLSNITLINGSIDETLSEALLKLKKLDFVFVDANHRYEPTLKYFHQILPFVHEGSIMVFDDIYWSKEMKRAWEAIKDHERVSISIDLFHCGIIFFRTNAPKQHYTLKIKPR